MWDLPPCSDHAQLISNPSWAVQVGFNPIQGGGKKDSVLMDNPRQADGGCKWHPTSTISFPLSKGQSCRGGRGVLTLQ